MKYILIDTNCWLDFIRNNAEEKVLEKIEFWFNSELLTILVPNMLIQEWERQSALLIESMKKDHDSLISRSSRYAILALNAEYERVREKTRRITGIMRKGILFEPSGEVRSEVTLRFEKNKAPFHINKNSTADALIYLSAINHIEITGESTLFFLTKNAKDFGQPGNVKKELHTDLETENIKVEYFTDPFHMAHRVGEGLQVPEVSPDDANADFVKQFVLVDRTANENFTTILFDTLQKHHDELPFIPTHILSRLFPFKIIATGHSYTYFTGFTLSTNNKQLHDYFRSIAIRENNGLEFTDAELIKGTPEEKERVHEILIKLNRNLVYNINLVSINETCTIQLKEMIVCDCVRCQYNNLSFLLSYKCLSESNTVALGEKTKFGYMHFQFGNYSRALEFYFEAYKQAKSEKKVILSYICLQNCKRLKFHIDALYISKSPEVSSIGEKLDKIALKDEIIGASQESSFVQENIKWISEKGYINSAKSEILETVEKIRVHYNSQLSGGYSSNSNLILVMSKFAELETYLVSNSILIGDDDMRDVFDGVLQGLFMSYKFNKDQGQRMVYFDEFWLLKIVFYARPERLIRLYQEYFITNLSYKSEEIQGKKFAELVQKFMIEYQHVMKLIPSEIEHNGYTFQNKYRLIFSNILILLPILDLGEENLRLITTDVVNNLLGVQLFLKSDYIYLGRFIYKNGKYLSDESVNKFIHTTIENADLHELTIFEALRSIVIKKASLQICDPVMYQIILDAFFKECPKCKKIHANDILVNIYFMLNDQFKKDLVKRLCDKLTLEFSPDIFYSFCVHHVISYDTFFEKFVALCPRPASFKKIRQPFERGESRLSRLGEILNLAFKYDMNLEDNIFQQYKGLSDYYDWLLNMEKFDYAKFDPEWVLQYPTEYYLRRIFTNIQTKAALKKYLIKNNNPTLRQYFIEYT